MAQNANNDVQIHLGPAPSTATLGPEAASVAAASRHCGVASLSNREIG